MNPYHGVAQDFFFSSTGLHSSDRLRRHETLRGQFVENRVRRTRKGFSLKSVVEI